MRNSFGLKFNPYFIVTLATIVAFVVLVLFTESDVYWFLLLGILIILQVRLQICFSSMFPLIAVLSLTEYYFLFSGKRVFLCELVYIPLFISYIFTVFLWRKFSYTKLIVLLLVFTIIVFQGINFLINSDLNSSLFRIRSLAFPLFLILMVNDLVKDKNDLKKAIRIILIVSVFASLVVYLQFFTGNFYILQNSSVTTEDINFLEGYLSSTQDSYLFSLMGLKIKGPIPPVGLNYFKFGYSEKIIVPASLFFAIFKFTGAKTRYIYLFFFILLLFATLLTGSRSVLVTLFFTMLIVHLFYKGKLKWGFVIFIILFFIGITYLIGPLLSIINLPEFGTLASRIFYMDDFFGYLENYPIALLAGNSPEKYLDLTGAGQPPHHFFAFGIIYDGLIASIVLLFAIYKLLKHTKRMYNADKELLAISYGLWASIFAFIFIYGQTSYLTWSIPHNMFFCIIIGLLIAAYRFSKQLLTNSIKVMGSGDDNKTIS